MGNCGSNPPAVEDEPGARERSYSASGTQVLFDRIDTLKKTVADLEGELAAQRKKSNGLEEELANLAEENETYKKEQEEVHSVVSGFEETVDKVVTEKETVIKQLQEELTKAAEDRKQAIAEKDELVAEVEHAQKEMKRVRSREQMNQTEREKALAASDKHVVELQKELAGAYANVTQAQSELLSTKASLSVMTDKNAQLKLRNVALEDALDELTDKYNRRDTQTRAQAQKQLDQAKELMVQNRESSRTEIEVARREAQELRSKVAQLAVELEQATSSVANANRESLIREALEKEVITCEEKLKKVNLELYKVEREKTEVEQELATTNSELKKARNQLEEVQSELENEKVKSAELQTLAEEAIAQAEGATGQSSPFAKQLAARRASMGAIIEK